MRILPVHPDHTKEVAYGNPLVHSKERVTTARAGVLDPWKERG